MSLDTTSLPDFLRSLFGITKNVSEDFKKLQTRLYMLQTRLALSGERFVTNQDFLGYSSQLADLAKDYYALRERASEIAKSIKAKKGVISQDRIDKAVGVVKKEFTDFLQSLETIQEKIEAAAKQSGIETPRKIIKQKLGLDGRVHDVGDLQHQENPQLQSMREGVKRAIDQGKEYGDIEYAPEDFAWNC